MDWDQRYQQNDTPWEKGAAAPPLLEYIASQPMSGTALVPGCGLGHDVRLLASHGCETLGIDISPLAIQKANAFASPPNLPASYHLCDFLDPNNGLPASHFDYLFEHTCFCAIDPSQRPLYVAAARKALKPGGQLIAILFTDMENDSGPPYPSSKDEIENLFTPSFKIARHWKPQKSFPGREGEESMYLMIKA